MKRRLSPRAIRRHLVALALRTFGCLWWAERQILRRGGKIVLTFHRVLEEDELTNTSSLPGIIISRPCFRQLLRYIAGNYGVVPLSGGGTNRDPLKLQMAITFDDGWRDNYTNAFGEALGTKTPFTVFICPGLIAREGPFWPERAVAHLKDRHPDWSMDEVVNEIEALKGQSEQRRQAWFAAHERASGSHLSGVNCQPGATLTWPEIQEMHKAGVGFGAHTQTHQILDTIEPNRARVEIAESRKSIERELMTPCSTFSYPNGNFTPEVRGMVEAEGFKFAFTTVPGVWDSDTDPLAIPRVNVSESAVTGMNGRFSPTMFRYKVIWRAWRAQRMVSAGASATRGTAAPLDEPSAIESRR